MVIIASFGAYQYNMNTAYTKTDLRLRHYMWNIDRREVSTAYDLDNDPLNTLEGYEVLIFANTFLDLYLPDHNVLDLNGLEDVLANHLPSYLTTRRDIASWLGKNLYFIKYSSRRET